jgi:acetyltransferase-like isoleucine patch superfamily enzyme
MQVGNNLLVRSRKHNQVDIFVASTATLAIGDHVFINQGVRISCSQEIRIGNGCQIADECVLIDNDYHNFPGQEIKSGPIIIENGVWLATRVIVLRGVTIGEGSVIGAGSVVTRSIPPQTFAAGAPARPIRKLV